ncbi:MAG: CO2 hydration protein [Leptolyngbya sp. SIO4C1]|nr:CO2 hydration protein [Leptolyngbya sp. SIO4C1]
MTQTVPPTTDLQPKSVHPLSNYVKRLLTGGTLLPDTPDNVLEVVGILDSYGVVLDAYSKNLIYIADHQFLVLFPFFKYFNGKVTPAKWWQHIWHDRLNFEYAEYCMRTMMWHGGGGLDTYLDSPEFGKACERAIQAKIKYNPVMQVLHRLFPEFLPEQIRQLAYYSGLGQFWRVMSDIFVALAEKYNRGDITSIPQIVEHIKAGLVADAARPISYAVDIDAQRYELIPESAGLTFLPDTAIPYVEAIFFRGTPFLGTVSYNAQAHQISRDQSRFEYGALYADPLPITGAGIPPTLLMQDMYRNLPDYLYRFYLARTRGERDIRVKICATFQKSMFCVTNAALLGLMPHPVDATSLQAQVENRAFLEGWMDRLATSRLEVVQTD